MQVVHYLRQHDVAGHPANQDDVACRVGRLVQDGFTRRRTFLAAASVRTGLMNLTTFPVFRRPFVIQIRPFRGRRFYVNVDDVNVLNLVRILPASVKNSRLRFPSFTRFGRLTRTRRM